MLQDDLYEECDDEHAFGAFLIALRSRVRGKRAKQKDIVTLLPGWTISSYSRLENGELAPRFDQLRSLYQAFRNVGVRFSPDARQQLIDLARKRIVLQRTHKDLRSDAEWAQLRFELARMDGLIDISTGQSVLASRPLLTETSHLIGREQWREEVIDVLKKQQRKKLLVIGGPPGVGKSSELNWLAGQILRRPSPSYRVILCDFRSGERPYSPEEALEVLLGTVLTELGYPLSQTFQATLEERVTVLLRQLEQARRPIV